MGTIPAVSVRELTKVFGEHVAVDHLTLDIPRGSFYGVVGPNGAGKTTMISMAVGLLRPTSGEAFIEGFNVWTQPLEAKRRYGLLLDGIPVFDRLSGIELLTYNGLLRGMDEDTVDKRAHSLLAALELEDAQSKQVKDYSAGMTKKILLACALLHNPDVLILDEPLESVDPVSSHTIQQILKGFVRAGGTVMMSSHVMELVEKVCDHVAIIDHGTVHAAGTLTEVIGDDTSLTEAFIRLVGTQPVDDQALRWLGHSEGE